MNLEPIEPSHVKLARDLYSRLKPGEEIKVATMMLSQPALDYFLSGCTGSAYTLGYRIPWARPDDFKNWILFKLTESLESDSKGLRSYVDPDRRTHYNYDTYTGLYYPKL